MKRSILALAIVMLSMIACGEGWEQAQGKVFVLDGGTITFVGDRIIIGTEEDPVYGGGFVSAVAFGLSKFKESSGNTGIYRLNALLYTWDFYFVYNGKTVRLSKVIDGSGKDVTKEMGDEKYIYTYSPKLTEKYKDILLGE